MGSATNPVMEAMNEALYGRVALVTGGGRGIGRAIALGLADAGARVAVLARSADEVAQTVSLIGERGKPGLAVPADVSVPSQVDATLHAIGDQWGPIEVLVNDAAVVWPLGPSVELDLVAWETALAINVTAVARLTVAVLPAMLERRWGRIVNVSSGIVANPAGMLRANAYATSKAALEAHTVNLAAELAGSGVKVNVFRPGGVDTAMQAWIRDQDPVLVGAALHRRFVDNYERRTLLSAGQSAASLLARLPSPDTGQIWDAADRL
jgi:NAD(P)-dependent dehydrogenase (short-subunit alcohol dehydrogenase family)